MSKLTRRYLLRSFGMGAGTLALYATSRPAQAQSVSFDALVKAAQAEKQLTYYAANDPATSKRIADAFNAKYGISVEIVRLASGPLAQRYAAEAETKNVVADLIVIAVPAFMERAIEQKWLVPVSGLPELEKWPGDNKTALPALVGINTITMAWNTKLVSEKDAPRTWEDALDPKWKGKILFTDPRSVPAFMGWAALMRDTYGNSFFERMAKQDLRIVASVLPGSQQLAAGEAHLMVPAIHQVLVPLQKAGAPLADTTPNPTSGVELFGGVSAAAPHPNAARLFLNFLLSREGQQLFNEGGGTSLLSGLKDVEPLPSGYKRPPVPTGKAADDIVRALGLS